MNHSLVPRSPETPPEHLGSTPEAAHELEQAWSHSETSLHQALGTLHLGVTQQNGFPHYHDEQDVLVPNAGIVARFSQSSGGYTGIEVRALGDETVEALNIDASGAGTLWKAPEEHRHGYATLSSDSGNMGGSSKLKAEDWARHNFGNPGAQVGIVRVTTSDGNRRFFAVGADFQGRPDSWRVSGKILELSPNFDEGVLALEAARKALPVGASAAETSRNDYEINPTLIKSYKDAFRHATPDVFVLHAPEGTTERAKQFSSAGLDLMIAMTEQQPDIFDGLEKQLDELGRRVRLVGGQEKRDITSGSFLDSLRDPLSARLTYLRNLKKMVDTSYSRPDEAYQYAFFAEQLFNVLEPAIDSREVRVDGNSAAMQQLQQLLEADAEKSSKEAENRAEVLQGSYMDPEHSEDITEERVLELGDATTIDLNAAPLLSKKQTYEAFNNTSHTDGSNFSTRERGYRGKTVAMLKIGDQTYAVVDARKSHEYFEGILSSKTGNHYSVGDERDKPPFILLQLSGKVDPMYGESVRGWTPFTNPAYDHKTQKILDITQPGAERYGQYGARGAVLEMPDDHTVLVRSTSETVTVTTARQ